MYEVAAHFNPVCLLRVREMELSLVSMYFPKVDAYVEDSFQKAERVLHISFKTVHFPRSLYKPEHLLKGRKRLFSFLLQECT